jgi:(p)ppGpp synthase/HD superfamily hydrolase
MRHRQIKRHTLSDEQLREQITALLKTVSAAHPGADIQCIERAYTVAARAHRGQWRKSGDPYITHPIAVATIVAELGRALRPSVLRCSMTPSRTPGIPLPSSVGISVRKLLD